MSAKPNTPFTVIVLLVCFSLLVSACMPAPTGSSTSPIVAEDEVGTVITNSNQPTTGSSASSSGTTNTQDTPNDPPNGAKKITIVSAGGCTPVKKNGESLPEGEDFLKPSEGDDYAEGVFAEECWLLPSGIISSNPFGDDPGDPKEIQPGEWAVPYPLPDIRGYAIDDVKIMWRRVYSENNPNVLQDWGLAPGEDVQVVSMPGNFTFEDGQLVIYSFLAFTPGSERESCFGTWAHSAKHLIIGEYTVQQIWRLFQAIENDQIQPTQVGVSSEGISRAVLLYVWEGMKILLFIGADIGPSIYRPMKADGLTTAFSETTKAPFGRIKDQAVEFVRCMRKYIPQTETEKAEANQYADELYRRPTPALPADFPGDLRDSITSQIPEGYTYLEESPNYLVPVDLQYYTLGDLYFLTAVGVLFPAAIFCTAAPEVCIPAGSAVILRFAPAVP